MNASRAYDAYREIPSKWLGHIPAHWEERRLSHVAVSWTSNVDKHSIEGQPSVRLCNYTDVYKNERISAELSFMRATATKEQINRFRLQVGDTIITKDSETADDIGIPAFVSYAADDLVCGYHLAMIRPDDRVIDPRFLYWTMASEPTLRQWGVLAAGVTRVGIRSGDLSKASVPVPPLVEQRAIAKYLDRETSRIDALVERQKQMIEVLRERRIAVVAEAATKGVDPRARMKDSGVEWLGDIPEHWQLRPLWSMFRRIKDVDHPDETMLSVFRDYGVVEKASRANLNVTAENRSIYQLVHPGWLVTNRMKAWQGSVGISALRGIVSGHYICFAPQHQEDSRYLNWLFRSATYTTGYYLISRGVRIGQAEIDNDDYRVMPVIVPPLAEQRAIADYLDEQTSKIDLLIAKAETFIELTKERRKALITAAVTGQIDVRGEVA